MGDTDAVRYEGEDYEVVDECMDEEDLLSCEQNINRDNAIHCAKTKTIVETEGTEPSDPSKSSRSIQNKTEFGAELNIATKESGRKQTSINASTENQVRRSLKDNPVKRTSTSAMDDSTIDFTADIPLDQFDSQKEITDEDVMQHLDVIENIVLDGSPLPMQDEKEQVAVPPTVNEKSTENTTDKTEQSEQTENMDTSEVKEDIKDTTEPCVVKTETESSAPKDDVDTTEIIEEKPDLGKDVSKQENDLANTAEDDWYEKKLAEKVATIRERLSKLARVLEFSYPSYQKWLEHAEKVGGSPICKLEPARRCPLNKPYTNWWKFLCSRKSVQETAKEAGSADGSVNKNVDTVWHLEPTGPWGVNIKNDSQFPPFVLRAVKIFEDFLQTTEQPLPQESGSVADNFTDDVSIGTDQKKDAVPEGKQQWLWLLVRCNSMDDLMLFATGRNIDRSTMDRLKQVYESGAGKDCNVKSLYCKSVNRCNDAIVTNTTFLVGSEALDEIVGGIKVQLAPKTNFWSNSGGAENIAKAVADLLTPNQKVTVLEIGCGIGVIGLMLASQCEQVIGVDSQSEVEEAEMTCELNNIKNASFIMGSPSEVTSKICNAVKSKTYAVVNANTNIGRALEVMTCLRKINTLRRLVMVTALTKQSVRAILELARPLDRNIGLPFMPVRACVVDTLPVGPHFQVAILMERCPMHKITQPWLVKPISNDSKGFEIATTQDKSGEQNSGSSEKRVTPTKISTAQIKKNVDKSSVKTSGKKGKIFVTAKKLPVKYVENLVSRNKFKGKRPHSPDRGEVPPKKFIKKPNKFKPWRPDIPQKKQKPWGTELPQLRINPLYEKKIRENKEQADLRERLSSNRVDTEIVQKVKEHQALLEVAKDKLSGPAPTVDVSTAKQLQNMLSMVLEQTNKLQNQLPRSVWDRIAPPETMERTTSKNELDDPLLKGRYVQDMGSQDILITAANKNFIGSNESEQKAAYKKYNNIPPLEPNLIMPTARSNVEKTQPERYGSDFRKQPIQENIWSREKIMNRWSNERTRKLGSPVRRQMSPMKHRLSPPRRFSPKRPLLSPPRRLSSPPRKHLSPLRRPLSPFRPRDTGLRRQLSPPRRPMSPPRRMMSPPRRAMSPGGRPASPPRRQMSPPRRQMPLMRQLGSPMRRQMSPPRRQITLPDRMMSPSRRELQQPRRQMMPQEREHVSPMRRGRSPHRITVNRPMSPSRRQQSPPRRQVTPLRRFNDDWDIPSRGAAEQNIWHRSGDRPLEKNIWQDDRQPGNNPNWEQSTNTDRYSKPVNQDKWDIKDSSRGGTWRTAMGETWPVKNIPKPNMKEQWAQNSDNRWSNMSHPGPSGDNWNIKGKESFTNRDDHWDNNKSRWESSQSKDNWNQDKDDWNDLPEDARDPWGDDANLGVKDRWQKFDTSMPTSSWVRESEKPDSWQNKGQHHASKPQWQSSGGNQNMGDSRWMSQNDSGKKYQPLSNWQSGTGGAGGSGPWQSQSFNFSSQRSFSSNQFKPSKMI